MEFLSGLIGAGAKLLGGIFSSNSAEKTAQANMAAQRDFAQHGVTWRAQDATRAQEETGINRLTLLGAPSASFSNIVGSTDLGDSIGSAGQDLGRSIAAATSQPSRADQLNEKLLEARIANVNADTVRMTAAASEIARKMGQPGTAPGIPFPTPDPRGPVIPLMQRARDPRTGEIVWIPSEKAASPLQTLAAGSTNIALAGRSLTEGLAGFDGAYGPAARAASSVQYRPYDYGSYTPF